MCGLILQYNKKGKDFPPFSAMLNEMAHRGVDDVSVATYQTCRVGFRRLAITEKATQQPGKAKGWIAYLNGEIYNYKDLGFEGTECEVLCQGFAKYGCEFMKQLNGMFCIVAIQGQNVYVFRDRYGIKPLYWWENGEGIVISSEIKPIIKHPDYKFAVNEAARLQWLTFNNAFTDDTLFQGIRKVEKGTYWHLNTGKIIKYWEWNFAEEPIEYEEAKREVKRLVTQSVERQTPKEVRFGSCLSGGIDSGIIANLLPTCPTFTAGYTEGNDERKLAELSVRGRHYEIVFGNVCYLEETIRSLEDLRVGASWSNYGLYELASKYVTVLFCGTGADEIFGGYKWRYEEPDYWNIVNRTGVENSYCRQIFNQAFFEDNLAERFKFDADYFLEGVLLVTDRLSMAHTIEVRPVFLDNDLVDFATKLPFDYKKGKRILKDAFSDILPKEVLQAKKQGWQSPDWFEGSGNQAKKWSEKALEKWMELFNFER